MNELSEIKISDTFSQKGDLGAVVMTATCIAMPGAKPGNIKDAYTKAASDPAVSRAASTLHFLATQACE